MGAGCLRTQGQIQAEQTCAELRELGGGGAGGVTGTGERVVTVLSPPCRARSSARCWAGRSRPARGCGSSCGWRRRRARGCRRSSARATANTPRPSARWDAWGHLGDNPEPSSVTSLGAPVGAHRPLPRGIPVPSPGAPTDPPQGHPQTLPCPLLWGHRCPLPRDTNSLSHGVTVSTSGGPPRPLQRGQCVPSERVPMSPPAASYHPLQWCPLVPLSPPPGSPHPLKRGQCVTSERVSMSPPMVSPYPLQWGASVPSRGVPVSPPTGTPCPLPWGPSVPSYSVPTSPPTGSHHPQRLLHRPSLVPGDLGGDDWSLPWLGGGGDTGVALVWHRLTRMSPEQGGGDGSAAA